MKKMDKLELSLLLAVAVTLVWYAAAPRFDMRWWTTAFAPLCDGILTSDGGGGDVVLRSKLWELLTQYIL